MPFFVSKFKNVGIIFLENMFKKLMTPIFDRKNKLNRFVGLKLLSIKTSEAKMCDLLAVVD